MLRDTLHDIQHSTIKSAQQNHKTTALEIIHLPYGINKASFKFIMTEMIQEWSKVYDEQYIQQISQEYPLGIGMPKQITPLICFLLSLDSSWITGQNIIINGGASL
ncbi:SDR family oxidoreductase [Helicobacter kayseriensis]|uniref:SDR family oxidoreductase n=1 Tax=Helicobacter kayseriensis TaxID=2905877 RepID=UPI001E4804EC|nr:SDR family oxidoreductase [Helicobacter kayseriensis]MCE3046677.1 SDR family oxidoreductase [Helicobacter kayseriensis]MCE3048021.1 SDR family oxidoreductase [Helicobacter kayseriensis]